MSVSRKEVDTRGLLHFPILHHLPFLIIVGDVPFQFILPFSLPSPGGAWRKDVL